MADEIKTTDIPQKELRSILNKILNKIKVNDIVQKMFDEYDVDLSEIDLIPMCFANIDVSARTDHGCIYFNTNLLDDPNQIDHYMVHEISHYLQQTTGTKPTRGADDGEYLDNPYEIEGFQKQVEYLADTQDVGAAEEYIDQVLDHHNKTDDKDKKDELLDAIAHRINLFKTIGV